MATTKIKEIMVCSDCGEEIYKCNACENYLNDCFEKEIICQEDDFLQKHYCVDCKPQASELSLKPQNGKVEDYSKENEPF